MSLYRFARAAVNIYAKLFFRVEYHGRENEPQDKDKAIIVISNHSSFNDALFTANAVKRDLSFIIKSSLIKHPLLGKFLTACNTIPIDRGNSDMQAIRVACKSVAEGKSIGVYPQGTRIPGSPPKPEQAMAGIGLIASRSKASFLPVAICCGNNKKLKPCLFRKVKVYVGAPVTYEEYSNINERPTSHEIAEYAFGKVCDLFKKYNVFGGKRK